MARFQLLPLELRLKIADEMPPPDQCHFASTCQLYWGLNEAAIRDHKQYYHKYRQVVARGTTVWDVLLRIIEEPKIARYVEELALPFNRYTHYEGNHPPTWFSPDPLSEVHATAIVIAVSEDPFLRGHHDLHAMEAAIRAGSESLCLARLLTLLSNLRTLHYGTVDDDGLFRMLLQRIASAYLYKTPPLPFLNLTYVSLAYEDSGGWIGFDLVMLLTQIPSLRQLLGDQVRSNPDYPDIGEVVKSRVKRLYFTWSNISISDWLLLLSNMSSLEHLHYVSVQTHSGSGFSDYRAILAALQNCTKHSLKSVKLVGEDFDKVIHVPNSPPISLRKFEKLETLCCSWRDLVPDPRGEYREGLIEPLFHGNTIQGSTSSLEGLAAVLPTSLESLGLLRCPDEELNVIARVLHSRAVLMPNLKNIFVDADHPEQIRDLAKQRGIRWAPELGSRFHGLPAMKRSLVHYTPEEYPVRDYRV